MDTATIQSRLTDAEAALHALMTGAREQEITAADGQRVTYTAVTMPQLQAYIADLRAQLPGLGRRPIYFRF